jgi:hypothetical protein
MSSSIILTLQNKMPTLPKKALIAEHKKLVRILTGGTRAERLKEAKAQMKELQKYIGRKF